MTCPEKSHLLCDYLERAQALAVEIELLLHIIQEDSGGEAEGDPDIGAWGRVEQARIHCDIAHLALLNHLTGHCCDGSVIH